MKAESNQLVCSGHRTSAVATTWRMLRTAKSFLPRRKGGHLRLQQMLPSVPRLVGDSRVGSFRKLPGQLRCRQPTHLASAFYIVLVCWDPFTGNHSRALRRKWQEGRQLGFWGECIMVYRQISVKLWDSRPVLIGLSDMSGDSCSGDLKWVVLHSLCVRVAGSAQYTESIFAWFRRVAHGNLWTVTGIDLLYAWLKHD